MIKRIAACLMLSLLIGVSADGYADDFAASATRSASKSLESLRRYVSQSIEKVSQWVEKKFSRPQSYSPEAAYMLSVDPVAPDPRPAAKTVEKSLEIESPEPVDTADEPVEQQPAPADEPASGAAEWERLIQRADVSSNTAAQNLLLQDPRKLTESDTLPDTLITPEAEANQPTVQPEPELESERGIAEPASDWQQLVQKMDFFTEEMRRTTASGPDESIHAETTEIPDAIEPVLTTPVVVESPVIETMPAQAEPAPVIPVPAAQMPESATEPVGSAVHGLNSSPTEWVQRSDQLMRGDSNRMDVTLTVHTSAWERVYKYSSWMRGMDEAFVRINDPSRFKGQGFLKIGTRLWNYLPTAERTILIPPSLMLDDFMGSDFSNDDLVKMSSISRDYTHELVRYETVDSIDTVLIQLLPKPDAPVVHGKLMAWLRTQDAALVKVEFYDFKMNLTRTLHYSNFKRFNDRDYPTTWKMVNNLKPGNETTIQIASAEFNTQFDSNIFTKQNLEHP